jgi:c-di-GMP-binding flagellar brake protein YcgR
MSQSTRRKVKRSQTWPDTMATLRVNDSYSETGRGSIVFKGRVDDLSAGGMFFQTDEAVPVPAKAEIDIDFDPASNGSKLVLKATGETVRAVKNGVGIRFDQIDLAEMQRCIISRMNRPG